MENSTVCNSKNYTDVLELTHAPSKLVSTTRNPAFTTDQLNEYDKTITPSEDMESNNQQVDDLKSPSLISFKTTLALHSEINLETPDLLTSQEMELLSLVGESSQNPIMDTNLSVAEEENEPESTDTPFDKSEVISIGPVISPFTEQTLITVEDQPLKTSRKENEGFSDKTSTMVNVGDSTEVDGHTAAFIFATSPINVDEKEQVTNSDEGEDFTTLEYEAFNMITRGPTTKIVDLGTLEYKLIQDSQIDSTTNGLSVLVTSEANQIQTRMKEEKEMRSIMKSTMVANSDISTTEKEEITISKESSAQIVNKDLIDLGGGKFQLHWRDGCYFTDFQNMWPLDCNISSAYKTHNIHQPSSAEMHSIAKMINDTPHLNFQIPFEFLSQSVLVLSSYDEVMTYQWNRLSLLYSDVVAMLRLSSFNMIYSKSVDLQWGQICWMNVYNKIQNAPKSSSQGKIAYEIIDFSNVKYPLIVFSNGTSIWRDDKMNKDDTVYIIQQLNSNLNITVNLLDLNFASQTEKLSNFVLEYFEERINKKLIYANYIWKTFNFSREELDVAGRLFLLNYEQNKTFDDSSVTNSIFNSSRELFTNSTKFKFVSKNYRSIIVYCNGTTMYDDISLRLVEIANKLKEIKSDEPQIGEKILDSIHSSTTVKTGSGNMKHKWQNLNNNPTMKVCYPINLGGGKVQFYMKNKWYITDGANVWPFNNILTLLYINEMVKQMDQRFEDDPRLDVNTIQKLVDTKFADCYYELVMPFQLLAQHYLFFKKHTQGVRIPILYSLKENSIKPEDVVAVLRLSAFNNFTTKELQFGWAKGDKLNWDWFIYLALHADTEQSESTRSYSFSSESGFAANNLQLKVNFNGSSDWGVQRLSLDETLVKLQDANSKYNFSLLEINGEYKVKDVDFELLIKEALQRRFNKSEVYCKYSWNRHSFSWFELLLCMRIPELILGQRKTDDAFWESVVISMKQSKKTNFVDRIHYDLHLHSYEEQTVVFMNETTVVKGVFQDIVELNKQFGTKH